MTNQPLSPAAAAVLRAAGDSEPGIYATIAAALRAAADRVVPEQFEPPAGEGEPWHRDYQLMSNSKWQQRQHVRAEFLAIAAELEAANG
jgi:hypothetical protein